MQAQPYGPSLEPTDGDMSFERRNMARLRVPFDEQFFFYSHNIIFDAFMQIVDDGDLVYVLDPSCQSYFLNCGRVAVDYFHGCIDGSAMCQLATDSEEDLFASELLRVDGIRFRRALIIIQRAFRIRKQGRIGGCRPIR